MVVLFNLTIKSIRGEEFTIQTDRDADTLGLKVQIWESRNIPVDSQRLVFAGRELQDAAKLADAGVGDGATLFMVEAANQNAPPPEFAQPAAQNPVSYAPQVPLIQADPIVEQQPIIVNIPDQQINGGRRVIGYEPLAPEVLAEERKNATYDLARWVRKYTLFTGFLLVVGAAFCRHGGHMLLPIFLTLLGWMSTRNLCRCKMGVYAAFLFVAAAFMVLGGITGIRYAVRAHVNYAWALGGLVIFVGILHFCIFACVVKLMSNVSKLTCEEAKEVRQRIATHRTLC